MKPLIGFFCAVLMAKSLLADPNYSIAIQQARNASAKETAANRRLEDNPPPTSPAQNNPPADPVLQATLQNIESLRSDFAAIGNATNGTLTAAQRQSLTNDLATAAQAAKAQPASIAKLADDLTTAIAGKEKSRAQQPKLAQYVHAIFNSSHLTAVQQQMIFSDAQKLLVNGGVALDDATNVVNDLKTIASETK